LIEPSVEEIKMAALETLRLANQAPSAVEILQFTGGTAQVPKIRRELAALFPRAELVDSEAFTAVAEGLATL
jgi:molecular chaperone DnaK (HSP70)